MQGPSLVSVALSGTYLQLQQSWLGSNLIRSRSKMGWRESGACPEMQCWELWWHRPSIGADAVGYRCDGWEGMGTSWDGRDVTGLNGKKKGPSRLFRFEEEGGRRVFIHSFIHSPPAACRLQNLQVRRGHSLPFRLTQANLDSCNTGSSLSRGDLASNVTAKFQWVRRISSRGRKTSSACVNHVPCKGCTHR